MGPSEVLPSLGSSSSASLSCWLTCCRAQYMSAPSSNTSVITESPLRDMLLRFSSRGMFAIAISMGVVMYCSTSCAPSEGAWVIICTWLLVMSGVESKGRLTSETTPHTASIRLKTPTTSLWLMEYSMSFWNMTSKA